MTEQSTIPAVSEDRTTTIIGTSAKGPEGIYSSLSRITSVKDHLPSNFSITRLVNTLNFSFDVSTDFRHGMIATTSG